jgi:hypothetical protein
MLILSRVWHTRIGGPGALLKRNCVQLRTIPALRLFHRYIWQRSEPRGIWRAFWVRVRRVDHGHVAASSPSANNNGYEHCDAEERYENSY